MMEEAGQKEFFLLEFVSKYVYFYRDDIIIFSWYASTEERKAHTVGHLSFDNVTFEMTGMTLRIGSRPNG